MTNKKITLLSVMLSIAIVLNIIEIILPPLPIILPGVIIRIGFSNIITLIVLYSFSFKETSYLHISRIILANLLSGRLFSPTFFNAFVGGLFSLISMYAFKSTRIFSIFGVSIIGSVFHIIGQILTSIIIYSIIQPFIYYFPILILISIFTGLFTAYISNKYLNIKKRF